MPESAAARRYPHVWFAGGRRGAVACRIVERMDGKFKIAFQSPDGPWEDTRYIKRLVRGEVKP